MPQLKMLENVLKRKETAAVNARKHFSRGLGPKWPEKGHLLPQSGINSELVSIRDRLA